MYFPYLRGKQEELLAMQELSASLPDTVVPILKPTSLSPANVQRYLRIALNGLRFAFITNSDDGAPAPKYQEALDVIDGALSSQTANVFPAYELRAGGVLRELQAFTQKYADRVCLIFHRNHTYTHSEVLAHISCNAAPIHAFLSGGVPVSLHTALPCTARVLIRDGFDRHVPNASYPPETSFDDLVFMYLALGFDGFGDFSIIGDTYSSGGGAAKHVALHLTEVRSTNDIITKHFVSRTPPTPKDQEAKYFDALAQLVAHVGNPPASGYTTAGVHDYIASSNTAHYPGLGKLKRWSIKHHTELVARILTTSGAVAHI